MQNLLPFKTSKSAATGTPQLHIAVLILWIWLSFQWHGIVLHVLFWSTCSCCVCFCLVTCVILFACLFHERRCVTGFIPPHILKNTREKFPNFPNRAQRKAYMLHLRTPKSRCPPSTFVFEELISQLLVKECKQQIIFSLLLFLLLWSRALRSGFAQKSGLFPICQ